MVRNTLLATAAVSLSLTASEASAHSVHQHHAFHHHHWRQARNRRGPAHDGWGGTYGSNVAAARARGMPWCGAEMADELGITGQQGRELWLARNWAHVGTPTSPHVGAVVVWRHHVGRIVGQENGHWVVRSGNVNGGVRSGTLSLAGAIAIRDVGFSSFSAINTAEQSLAQAGTIHRHRHDQHLALVEHRSALWMHEETVQPDRFGAAVD